MEDLDKRSIKISRTFNAPVEMLWKVLTTADYIKDWWGPDGFTNNIEEMEVKKGGKWRFTMKGPDGESYLNEYVYEEVEHQKKIVLRHLHEPNLTIVITLDSEGDKTKTHWQNIFDSVPSKEEAIRAFKADKGLEQNMEKLKKYLNNLE